MESHTTNVQEVRRATPNSERMLSDNHFIRITGLYAGEHRVVAREGECGRWSVDHGFVIAVTRDGEVWLGVEPQDPVLTKQQTECLLDVCRSGMGGPIFDVDAIPMRYILARAQDPNFDPLPRH